MKKLGIFIVFALTLLFITSCEQKTAYKTYENGRLPYILDVPETWEMDESNPLFIKFLNADHTLSISCEIGEFTLIPEEHFEAFYDFLYEEHEDSIFNKASIQKTDSLYILNWKGKEGVYVFDGSKTMNGYLCGIQVAATAETQPLLHGTFPPPRRQQRRFLRKSGLYHYENSQTRKNYCFSIIFSRFYLEVIKRCFTFAPKIIIERR